jgi:hypothetical protein
MPLKHMLVRDRGEVRQGSDTESQYHNKTPCGDGALQRRLGLALFLLSFVVFIVCPVSELLDTKFSLLTTEGLFRNQTPALNGFSIAGLDAVHLPAHPDLAEDRDFYQLVRIYGKILYRYPHGGSILALPAIAVMDAAGVSVARAGDTYDPLEELVLGRLLASLLMAILVAVFFRTAILMLPVSWSIAIAAGGFATQIWSSASRALWSQTWEIFLAGWVVLLLVRVEQRRLQMGDAPNPVILATLLSWIYFVRPTGAIVIIGVSVLIALHYRETVVPFVITGAIWLAAFLLYSLRTFGQFLPDYYHQGFSPELNVVVTALAANLISPSRGLFVFVPAALWVFYLTAVYWSDLHERGLAVLAMAIIVAHLVVVSSYVKWWGGPSYGPRLLMSLVPWFVLLAILDCKAMLSYCPPPCSQRGWLVHRRVIVAAGLISLGIGALINAHGAISWQTYCWSFQEHVDEHPARVWDWRSPQFMAGLATDRHLKQVAPVTHGDRQIPETAPTSPCTR